MLPRRFHGSEPSGQPAPAASSRSAFRTLPRVQMGKSGEVGCRLSTRAAPGPFFPDALGESQLQDHIETVVRSLRYGTEEPIDRRPGNQLHRQSTSQIDVTERVQGEANPMQSKVALQQPSIDACMVLIGIAGNEGPYLHRVLSHLERTFGDELTSAGQSD